MTDAVHGVVGIVATSSVGYGLWLIYPPAAFVGIGGLFLFLIWAARTDRGQHGRDRDNR